MQQSSGRIDARPTMAKTGADWVREKGGLAPDYSSSFGGLKDFYDLQKPGATQHEKLQEKARGEQLDAGGFYRPGSMRGEQVDAMRPGAYGADAGTIADNNRLPGPPPATGAYAAARGAMSPTAPVPALPSSLQRGPGGPASGVLELGPNKYGGSGFSVGGDKYQGNANSAFAPPDAAAQPMVSPGNNYQTSLPSMQPGDQATTLEYRYNKQPKAITLLNNPPAPGGPMRIGQIAAAPPQPAGQMFAAPPAAPGAGGNQLAPPDRSAYAPRGTINQDFLNRQVKRFARTPEGAAIISNQQQQAAQAYADRQFEADKFNATEAGKQARSQAAINATNQRAQDNIDRAESIRLEGKSDKAAKEAGENQIKGNEMANALSVQQQRSAELIKSGAIKPEDAGLLGYITDPKILKETLDRYEGSAPKPTTVETLPDGSRRYVTGADVSIKDPLPEKKADTPAPAKAPIIKKIGDEFYQWDEAGQHWAKPNFTPRGSTGAAAGSNPRLDQFLTP